MHGQMLLTRLGPFMSLMTKTQLPSFSLCKSALLGPCHTITVEH